MAMLRRLLIANRGEIACRIIRTARRLGITSIAVFSDVDRGARHVSLADEAVHIGPAPAAQSYLSIDAILAAASRAQADAIHPGYGFLSENAEFAAACVQAGLIWVGPPAAAIAAMGSKSAAKEMMAQAGVPVLPGYHGSDQSADALTAAAARVGYPIILKAVAGGGGKGMQIVHDAIALPGAIESARRIARSAFRNDALLLERYLAEPRHVEVQIFADQKGNVVHLLDRDCSVQRRHQKVIEEAPAPGVSAAVRAAMAQAALTVARTVSYVGAGTVEFLLDASGAFYFMEMNTRLQVEHPVTEAITGLDLVELQLRVASGEALPAHAAALAPNGHAVEARIYAEDPANDYLPSVGRIVRLRWPAESPELRIDTGVAEGDEISSHYDPLIAKIIAHGATRDAAVARLGTALRSLRIVGVRTNTEFVARVLAADAFATANLNTRLLERVDRLEQQTAVVRRDLQIAAALWLATRGPGASESPWAQRDAWRLNLPARQTLWLRDAAGLVAVEVVWRSAGLFDVGIADASVEIGVTRRNDEDLQLLRDGRSIRVEAYAQERRLHVWSEGREAEFEIAGPAGAEPQEAADAGALASPLPGTVVALEVRVGDQVKARQTLIVVEAMKMEHSIRAAVAGTVTAIHCKLGQRVSEGVALIELGP